MGVFPEQTSSYSFSHRSCTSDSGVVKVRQAVVVVVLIVAVVERSGSSISSTLRMYMYIHTDFGRVLTEGCDPSPRVGARTRSPS